VLELRLKTSPDGPSRNGMDSDFGSLKARNVRHLLVLEVLAEDNLQSES